MSDDFTETVTTGWFSRIGSSIKGILVGLIMIVVAFPVLFWNEGRAVKTRKDLDQGAKECLSVRSDTIDSANENKLIHTSGVATAGQTLTDSRFGVSVEAIRLVRKVEMYQWQQEASTSTENKLGGKEEKTTTYHYRTDWAEGRIDSGQFRNQEGHANPSRSISSQMWSASPVKVGSFTLSTSLVNQIDRFSNHLVEKPQTPLESIDALQVHFNNGQFYLGNNPAIPAVGDLRVSYQAVLPTDVSIIARQTGQGFSPFEGDSGTIINMLSIGTHTADAMFDVTQQSNKMLTWILRLVGCFVMFIGFNLIFKPLSVVADVLPIAGDIVGIGTGIVAFLLALPLSLVTISLAWIFYRPLIGIPLVAVACLGLYFLVSKIIAARKARS